MIEDIKYNVLARSSKRWLILINGTGIVLHTGFGRAPFRSQNLIKIAKKWMGM